MCERFWGGIVGLVLLLAANTPLFGAPLLTTVKHAKKELSLLKAIEALDFAVQKHAQQVHVIQGRLGRLMKVMTAVDKSVTLLRQRIADQRGYFARRLSAIRFLHSRGPVTLLISSSTFGSYVRRQWLIRKLISADRQRLISFQTNRRKLDQRRVSLSRAKGKLFGARQELTKKEGHLKQLLAEKQAVWEKIKRSRWFYFRYREEMSLARRRLMAQLLAMRRRVINRKWDDLKGRFLRPVWGRLVARFGTVVDRRFRTVTQNNGVLYRTHRRQAVRAAYSGSIAFVGTVTGFGTVVVVDHANRLFSLSGHLAAALVKKGQFVTRGQLIGRAGTGPGGRSALYFEVREKGTAVDPMHYLRRRR